MWFSSQASVRGSWIAGLGLTLVVIAGCGVEEYERRLAETSRYYAELERIELNLSPSWRDGVVVESLRVPNKFQPIFKPIPKKNEEGQEEEPVADPRQPDYINLVFPDPELVGAWEAPFEIPVEKDGQLKNESFKGYIYVLSNYWDFASEETAGTALKFTANTVQLISDALEQQLPKDKLEAPDQRICPKPGGYFPSNYYAEFVFKPKEISFQDAIVNYQFTAFARKNGNIECIIVTVMPENVSSKEKLPERVQLMLEHFAFTRNEPRRGQAQGQPGQAQPVQMGF